MYSKIEYAIGEVLLVRKIHVADFPFLKPPIKDTLISLLLKSTNT